MVRRLVEERRGFETLTVEEWTSHSPLFEADVQAYITGEASVRRKRTPQSTHPDAVAESLRTLRAWLTSAGA